MEVASAQTSAQSMEPMSVGMKERAWEFGLGENWVMAKGKNWVHCSEEQMEASMD